MPTLPCEDCRVEATSKVSRLITRGEGINWWLCQAPRPQPTPRVPQRLWSRLLHHFPLFLPPIIINVPKCDFPCLLGSFLQGYGYLTNTFFLSAVLFFLSADQTHGIPLTCFPHTARSETPDQRPTGQWFLFQVEIFPLHPWAGFLACSIAQRMKSKSTTAMKLDPVCVDCNI